MVGPKAVGKVDLNDTITMNLYRVAKALNKPMDSLIVAILARPRHEELIRECRAAGAHVKLFNVRLHVRNTSILCWALSLVSLVDVGW